MRRRILARRPVTAGHLADRQIGIGAPVGHHAARGDDAVEAGRIDGEARRQVAEIVAGRGDDEDAPLIERVDGIGPGGRGDAAHAHGHDMDARLLGVAQRMDIVEGAGDRAVAEQHHPVGDPDRDDIEIAGGAQRPAIDILAGEDAERAGAVAEHRIDQGRRLVRCIRSAGRRRRNCAPGRVQEARFGGVAGIVAGIEMGDTHDVAGRRRRDWAPATRARVASSCEWASSTNHRLVLPMA